MSPRGLWRAIVKVSAVAAAVIVLAMPDSTRLRANPKMGKEAENRRLGRSVGTINFTVSHILAPYLNEKFSKRHQHHKRMVTFSESNELR